MRELTPQELVQEIKEVYQVLASMEGGGVIPESIVPEKAKEGGVVKKPSVFSKKYPPGWDQTRIQRVLAHYEEQTEEEAVFEDEAAFENLTQTTVKVPVELLAEVRELIAKHRAKPQSPR